MIGIHAFSDMEVMSFMVESGLRAVFSLCKVIYILLNVKKTLHLVKYTVCSNKSCSPTDSS